MRKKAVMALHRFMQLDPDFSGSLARSDFDRHLRLLLCDKVCFDQCPLALNMCRPTKQGIAWLPAHLIGWLGKGEVI